MDSRESQERLLDDVLGPVPGAGLDAGLAEMRRLRARRRLVRVLACAASLAVAALWLREREVPPVPPPTAESTPTYLLRTRPLRPGQLVVSRSMRVEIVASTVARVDRVLAREAAVALVVRREPHDALTDAELLDCFQGCPVALLATAPGTEEIVFIDPSDRDRFLGPPDR